ncbi:hypothetical protein AB1Y20_021931 [Prymnesium parvum]|uniref:ADP-ribosylation factor-like protein 2-binding protein n=1 Tax=Prymnesium parvum TaxID=97485 RepID=A0AB34JEV7_PRYPA
MEDEVSFDKSEDDEELLSVAANDEPIDAARTSGAPSPVDGKYIVEVEEQVRYDFVEFDEMMTFLSRGGGHDAEREAGWLAAVPKPCSTNYGKLQQKFLAVVRAL